MGRKWQSIASEPDPCGGKNLALTKLTRNPQRICFQQLCKLPLILGIFTLFLAGCGAESVSNSTSFRNPGHPLGSQADVTLDRLKGDWRIVHSSDPKWTGKLTFSAYSLSTEQTSLSLSQIGPGRFDLHGREVWVHWMDGDNRTAAIGALDGGLVWIMDRTGRTNDRTSAAQEILDWYGYDLRRINRRP